MILYQLMHSTDDNIIGKTYPQSQNMLSEVNISNPRHLWCQQGEFSDDVYVPDSILHPKAKVTDFISSSPIMYPILSEKLKTIFESYRYENIQFVRTRLLVRGRVLKYWIMNIYKPDFQLINYNESIFEKINGLNNNSIRIYPKTESEFFDIIREKKTE